MKREITYIHIKDNTASVSEDMRRVLNFLMEIENEIKTIFDFKNFRELRNSLTHFFSIFPRIIIVQDYDEKVAKTEKVLLRDGIKDIAVISPNDLLELIKSAHHLLFGKWSDDCDQNSEEFNKKIKFVIELVEKQGAYVVNEGNINL